MYYNLVFISVIKKVTLFVSMILVINIKVTFVQTFTFLSQLIPLKEQIA